MSQLIDKLTHVRKPEPQPIGFMAARTAAEKPGMQLVAVVKTDSLDIASQGLKSADAVILEINTPDDAGVLEKKCQGDDKVIFGGWLKAGNSEVLDSLMKSGCDFAVFSPAAPLSITADEKIGRILELDITLSEALLRTVNDLPVDGVLVSGREPETGLTIDRLMQLQRLMNNVRKPVIVPVADDIARDDLQALWNMGITGAAVEVIDQKTAGKLDALRKVMKSLSPAEIRKKEKTSALLPRLQPESPASPRIDNGDEEEDDQLP